MASLNLTVQPLIVVVGETLREAAASYVSVDDVLYKIDSVIKAIDVCFKIFHVLHVKYPPECSLVWLLLQKGIYRMSTKWDKKSTKVYTLLQEFKKP